MRMKIWSVTLLCLLAPMVMAGEIEDILKKHWDALGGLKAYQAIDNMSMEGTLSVSTPGGQMDIPMKMMMKGEDKIRFEMAIQGMSMIQCINGDKGWQINPMMGKSGAQDLTEEEIKALKEQGSFMTDLIDYKEDGTKLEYKGKADVEGTETYHITATRKDGTVNQYYFDTENDILIKSTGMQNQNGMKFEADTFYSDYKEVGKVIMPHVWTVKPKVDGGFGSAELRFEKINPNADIADSEFEKPAAE